MQFRIHWVLAGAALAALHANAATIDYISLANSLQGGGFSQNYDYLTGLAQHLPPQAGVTLIATDTPGTNTPGLTSASIFASDLGTGGTVVGSSATAWADLASGQLGAAATSISAFGLGFGSVTVQDNVHFSNTTGAPVAIDVSYSLDGGFTNPALFWDDIQTTFCFGLNCQFGSDNTAAADYNFDWIYSQPPSATVTTPTTGYVSGAWTGSGPDSETFNGTYLVPVGQSSAFLYMRLAVDCRFGAACDYAHTASLGLGAVNGVSFTSDSGTLLTTPEPATFLCLLLAGVILLSVRGARFSVPRRHSCRRH